VTRRPPDNDLFETKAMDKACAVIHENKCNESRERCQACLGIAEAHLTLYKCTKLDQANKFPSSKKLFFYFSHHWPDYNYESPPQTLFCRFRPHYKVLWVGSFSKKLIGADSII